jgi:glycogen synthase
MRAQRRAYEAARACCVTSRWAADSIVEDYGIEREKVHVVGIGRNHDAAPCDRDWSRPRFLWVGAEWERKNGPAVVAAFARIRDVWPDARLDLVGNHPPVHVDGVVGHGRLRLSVPAEHAELERLYGAATCYVMPSRYEAAGIVFADAGAAGLPSIGSTVGGSAEIIGPGGVVVDPEDDAALAVAMGRLADPEVARRMGAAARTHAESLTWVHVAERLLRVLRVR